MRTNPTDPRRLRWVPTFEFHEEHVIGQLWPLIIVEYWERNEIGELRFVDARVYSPPVIPDTLEEAP